MLKRFDHVKGRVYLVEARYLLNTIMLITLSSIINRLYK